MRYESELRHYGIPGQKWGVRRFQEENGTYTAAGRERYRRESSDVPESGEKTGLVRVISEAIIPGLKEKRIEKATKELEDAGIRDRFDDKEFDRYSKISNGRFRKAIVESMKKDSKKTYSQAYIQQMLKSAGLSLALAIPMAFAINKFANSKALSVIQNFLNVNSQKKVSEIEDRVDLKTVKLDYDYELSKDLKTYTPSDAIVAAKRTSDNQYTTAPRIDFDKRK